MNLDELSTSISLKPENSDKIESRIYIYKLIYKIKFTKMILIY